MTTPTYAVTAATGSYGTLAVEALIDRVGADRLAVLVRDPAKAARFADRGVSVRQADYDDLAALTAGLAGVERLLLVSGSEVGRRVAQHGNVVAAASAAGVAHVAYTSAPRADTTSLALAPEHKATEDLLRDSGLAWTLLRNNWYSENYIPQLQPAAATGEIVGSAGTGLTASASRDDYAVAAAVVLTSADAHVGAVYELGGDVAWDRPTLAATIGEIVGREVVYRDVSTAEHIEALTAAGLDAGTAGFVAQLDADTAAGTLAEVTGDLATLLGRPTTPLRDTLAAAWSAR